MKEVAIEEKLRMLEKELDILTQQVDHLQLDLKERVDGVKIELTTVKVLMSGMFPEFKTRYAEVKAKIAKQIDPETLMM